MITKPNDVLGLLEQLAQLGTAPEHGCDSFSVGFDEPIERLRQAVIDKRFRRGAADVKFVIGPYGSGKTHFLRHLQAVAENEECVTGEVALNLDVDYTKPLLVFREVARQIRPPGGAKRGMSVLLQALYDRVVNVAEDGASAGVLLDLWFGTLDGADLSLPEYPRVMKRALNALHHADESEFELCQRWLSGEMTNRAVTKALELPNITASEENLFGHRAMITLFQIVRHAGYRGTVIAYDEADQGFTVDRKRTQKILSMLQSTINAFAAMPGIAAFLVYALTPDVIDTMETYPALQQRIADPGPGMRFFDGNTRAARVDLRDRNVDRDLIDIGRRLVDLLYDAHGEEMPTPRTDMHATIEALAQTVMSEDLSSANRRTLVKRAATTLLATWDPEAYSATTLARPTEDDEV
jgi:energy-coupling factor transporter ATP-binding protein EcfA2